MEEQAPSPSGTTQPLSTAYGNPDFTIRDITSLQEDLFAKFSTLLERGLANTASQITNSIKSHLNNLGSRIEAMEDKIESNVSTTNQNAAHIQTLQDQLDMALSRIDVLKNRSRRYNFRIRGLPESYTDVPLTVRNIISELIPNVTILPSRRRSCTNHAYSLTFSIRGTRCRYSLTCPRPPFKEEDFLSLSLLSCHKRTLSTIGHSPLQ